MIYFIRAGEDGPVKIGFARESVRTRLKELQTAHYETLELVRVISGTRRQERELHRRFGALRIRGEWFRFDPEMLTIEVPAIRGAEAALEPEDGSIEAPPFSISSDRLLAEWATEDAVRGARRTDKRQATVSFPPFKQIPLPPAPASQRRL